jgi:hypothetical protein
MAGFRSAALAMAAIYRVDASDVSNLCRSETALMQTKSETDIMRVQGLQRRASASQVQAACADAARHIRSYLADPSNVGDALAKGLGAVSNAMPVLTSEPPQFEEGMKVFSVGLLQAIELMIPGSMREEAAYAAFKEVWEDAASSLAASHFETDLSAFRLEGDVSALMRIWAKAIDELGVLVTRHLPGDVGAEVIKFMEALEDALDGFDAGIGAFMSGETEGVVEFIGNGLKQSAQDLLPAGQANSTSLSQIMSSVDEVFGELSKFVLTFQENLLKADVCWKRFEKREKTRPSVCPTGFHWDGENWCFAVGGDASLVEFEASVRRKRPEGAIPARCNMTGSYREKRGSWCYKGCPYGFEEAGGRCRSACIGSFPVNSPLMCGKKSGTIAKAIWEMATRTLRTGLSLFTSDLKADLKGTVQSLTEAGKGFAYPRCPAPVSN